MFALVLPIDSLYPGGLASSELDYSRKKCKQEGFEHMEFPGVSKKEHVEISGVN